MTIKNLINLLVVLGCCFLLPVANASITPTITPEGEQVANRRVLEFNYQADSAEDWSKIESFKILFAGGEITDFILENGEITEVSPTHAKISVEAFFPGGVWSFSTSIKLIGEAAITKSVSFTTPGDLQEQRKNSMLVKITEFANQWNEYKFSEVISIWDYEIFRARLFDEEVDVYVDPEQIPDLQGAYYQSYVNFPQLWEIYWRDLVFLKEPWEHTLNGEPDISTLWHETIHAISHGYLLQDSPLALSPSNDADEEHEYIDWAEQRVLKTGIGWLINFETYVADKGTSVPVNPAIAEEARFRWQKFLEVYNELRPDMREKFGAAIGFDFDPQIIKSNYILNHNFPVEYFDSTYVRIDTPGSGSETGANQIEISASIVLGDPSISVESAFFEVNGGERQLASVAEDGSFSTIAVLATGENQIIAGFISADAEEYLSNPITVVSTAENNSYQFRIVWDKDDTDVDLSFSWSGGAKAYWGNRSPDWGGESVSPRLDVDDTNGFGPENITIGALPGPGTYTLEVHYYSDHGNGGTNVTASVYADGVQIVNETRFMTDGERWTVFTVEWEG